MNKITSNVSVVFDALAYAKKLMRVSVPSEQATVHAEAISDVVGKLATKDDLCNMQQSLEKDIEAVRMNLSKDIGTLRGDVKKDMEITRMDLKIWFGSMLATAVMINTALVTLISVLYKH